MDLTTRYLGFDLPHPFIVGASPLTDDLSTARACEDAGAAAIIMRSLFEEQLDREGLITHRSMDTHAESFAEALTYFPDREDFKLGPEEYLDHVRRLKAAVDIPVIGSLNGRSPGGWLEYARQIEEAGADAIELHIYSLNTSTALAAEEAERQTVEMVSSVKEAVTIPVAVKLSAFHTCLAHLGKQLDDVRADGLVLFNRFYHPDIDIENLEMMSRLDLSTSAELPLRLRWLAILSGQVRASLAVTGGVHSAADAIKAVMSGAHAIQLVSALLRHGPQYLARLRLELNDWMEANEYESLRQMCGNMSMLRCPDPQAFNRASYMRVLQGWNVEV